MLSRKIGDLHSTHVRKRHIITTDLDAAVDNVVADSGDEAQIGL